MDSSNNFKTPSFDANLSNCFSAFDDTKKDEIFMTLLSSKDRNSLHDIIADHYKAQYNTFLRDKQFSHSHTIHTNLTPSDQRALCDVFPGIEITFTRRNLNAHAYACASRSLEFINILYERIKYDKTREKSFYPNLLKSGGWDVLVKDVGGDPLHILNNNLTSFHTCAPVIKTNSYDSVRQTGRVLNVLTHNHDNSQLKTQILHGLQGLDRTNVSCDRLAQDCRVKAPFLMFVHSLYDMSLTDVANAMDSSNALIGYGSIIYTDDILIRPSGTFSPLGVWWEYSDPLDGEQWSHERMLYHTAGTIRFGFSGDDGFNYVHNLANYKSYFMVSRFSSSRGVVYNLELLDNRNGIQFIKFTRELTSNIIAGIDHTITLKSLQDKYILSFFEYNTAWKSQSVRPTPVHHTDDISWVLPEHPKIKPIRFSVPCKPIDDAISFLTTVKDNLKPSEVLNFLRCNSSKQIVNGSVLDGRLMLDSAQLGACARALYLFVYNANYHNGKVVQQAISDIDCTRKSNTNFRLFTKKADHLNLTDGRVFQFFRDNRSAIRHYFSLAIPSVLSYSFYKILKKFIPSSSKIVFQPHVILKGFTGITDTTMRRYVFMGSVFTVSFCTSLCYSFKYFKRTSAIVSTGSTAILTASGNKLYHSFTSKTITTDIIMTYFRNFRNPHCSFGCFRRPLSTTYQFVGPLVVFAIGYYTVNKYFDRFSEFDINTDGFLVRPRIKYRFSSKRRMIGDRVCFVTVPLDDDHDRRDDFVKDITKAIYGVDLEDIEPHHLVPSLRNDDCQNTSIIPFVDSSALTTLREKLRTLPDAAYLSNKKSVLPRLPSDCINRSQVKLRDIMNQYSITTKFPLDLCSAPGGFVFELSKTAELVTYKPYISSQIHMHPSVLSLTNTKDTHYLDGDILSAEVLNHYFSESDKYDLVTADGAIETTADDPESINFTLITNECRLALHFLDFGGTFILKIFDALHENTRTLIQDVSTHFSRTELYVSPNASPISSEIYVIFINRVQQREPSLSTTMLTNFVRNNVGRLTKSFSDFIEGCRKDPVHVDDGIPTFEIAPSPADGDCCYHAACCNRDVNIPELRKFLLATLPLTRDLEDELQPGAWGGSAFLDAFGKLKGVTYLVHYGDSVLVFGSEHKHREVHLRLSNEHYDLMIPKHSGVSITRSITSFPSTNLHQMLPLVNEYFNVSGQANGIKYSRNLSEICIRHVECLNNGFVRYVDLCHDRDNLLFFIEKNRAILHLDSLNDCLSRHSLVVRLHCIYFEEYYVVTTHTSNGLLQLSMSDFDSLDSHFTSCTCSSPRFRPQKLFNKSGIIYYCQSHVKEFVEAPSGLQPDYTISLLDHSKKCSTDDVTVFDRTSFTHYVHLDEQRRCNLTTVDSFHSLLKKHFNPSAHVILIITDCVDPFYFFQKISLVYPHVAVKYYINRSGSGLRDPNTVRLELSERDIHVNAMLERRIMWYDSIDYVITSLKTLHEQLLIQQAASMPLSVDNVKHNFYDVIGKRLLVGRDVDLTKVRWAWDGVKLITFDDLSNVHKYTDQHFVSFNPDSVLLTGYYHYELVKNLVVEDIVNTSCLYHQVQGVPGAGKTQYIIDQNKEASSALLLTVSKTACDDLRRRFLSSSESNTRDVVVATFDSFMINYKKNHDRVYDVVWFDEALLTHGGDWLWVAALTSCKNFYIVGDQAQIPYIDRTRFHPKYVTPAIKYTSTMHLSKSYRCPLDIVHWMNCTRNAGKPLYSFTVLYHDINPTHSVSCKHISSVSDIPKIDGVIYLVFTQAELSDLSTHFNLPVNNSVVKTVHQYQGNQSKNIILVRTEIKNTNRIYSDMNYVLVALTRHTESLAYYSVNPSDVVFTEITRIKAYSAAEIRLRAGGPFDTPHKTVTIIPSRTQLPYTFPRIVQGLNDVYGFGSYIPMVVRSTIKHDGHMISPPLEADPLSIAVPVIQKSHDDFLGYAPDNEFDHELYQLSDKHFHGEFSIIPKYQVPVRRFFCPPRLRTNMRPRVPFIQSQVVKAFVERNGAIPRLSGDVDHGVMAEYLLHSALSVFDADLMNLYAINPIHVNGQSISIWLSKQPSNVHSLIESDTETLWDKDLTVYNFTIKGNPKPDLDPYPGSRYKSSQTIAYQDKLINAIFCPLINDLTDRVFAALSDNVLLFNRMSNDEFCLAVDRLCPFERFLRLNRFVEIDFSKFDKSQDLTALRFEVALMRLFGVPEIYCRLWIIMHKHTQLRDRVNLFRARVDYQRKSGDAGTWIFNTLFQMAVVINSCSLENKLRLGSAFAVFSGDDSLVFLDTLHVSPESISHTCSSLYNLEVKLLNYSTPYFCSKFFIPTPDGLLFIPDVLKTIVKLGRKDIVNRQHAYEYFISFRDNNSGLSNANYWHLISKSLADRYKVDYDHSLLIHALYTLTIDQEMFMSLWDYTDAREVTILPKLEL